MKSKRLWIPVVSLSLALALLPFSGFAQSGGLADSNALAYEKALQMLTTSSLTNGDKLADIQTQFTQAGSYQFGVEYLTFVEALLLMQQGDANRYDDALDSMTRLNSNIRFTKNYYGQLDKTSQPVLPDLETLIQYIEGRKLEAYGDSEGAIALFDAYPVLDAVSRAGSLAGSIKSNKYERSVQLLSEASLLSVQQAAGLFSELGGYRDSAQRLKECQAKIAKLATPVPTLLPTPNPTAKPTSTPVIAVTVPIYYMSTDDTILYEDRVTYLTGSKNTYHANDAFVPDGYKLSSNRDVSIVISANGTVTPTNVMLIYELPFDNSISAGSTIYFGSYEQDDLLTGREEIEWRVLAVESGKALLISVKCLGFGRYHSWYESVTWKDCLLRDWLNGDFLNAAFTSTQMKAILLTSIMNDRNSEYGTYAGSATKDRVFLLSESEAKEYFSGDNERVAHYKSFAQAHWWWLRSPGYISESAAVVGSDGSVFLTGFGVNTGDGAIRPALWVDLASGIF